MLDSGLASTEPITSSGRRALNVRLNSNGAVAVGIDFGRRHLRVVLASLSYHVIAEESVMLPLGHQADEGIQAAMALLDKLLLESGVERSAVVGAASEFRAPSTGALGPWRRAPSSPNGWASTSCSILRKP